MKKYITKQSNIKGAGKGLFTKAAYKKGEVIGLAHVDGQPTIEIGKNHNHNEKTPTANNVKNGNKRYLVASRNLQPGEEITTNYRLQPDLEQPEDFQKKKGGNMTPQKDGYRTYSPFKKLPYIDVESNTIDSNNIVYDLNLQADNGLTKFVKKNTGLHTLPGAKVIREIPAKRKGGLISLPTDKPEKSKKFSRSLDATNRLFTENNLFKKPKSRKNKVFDPHAKYYAEGGTYEEAELTPEEIEAYRAEGYTVDDNEYQDGDDTDAMNGMMKARLAYANEFGNPAAKRMINLPDTPYQFDNGDTGTHYMASMDNYAVPQIQDENGELQLGDYGPESNEAIRFDSDEDANYFAENYKDVSPGFLNEKQYGGGLHKLQEGGSPYYSYGNKKYIKKKDGTWFVESNGEYVPITENVKARTAELNKNAKYNSNYNKSKAFKDKLKKSAGNYYIPESERQAYNNYNDGPVSMVYPEKYFIGPAGGVGGLAVKGAENIGARVGASALGQATKAAFNTAIPLGKAITSATAGTLTPANLVGLGFGLHGAYSEPENLSKFISNPNLDTGTDLAFSTLEMLGSPGVGNALKAGLVNPWQKGYKEVPIELPGSPNVSMSTNPLRTGHREPNYTSKADYVEDFANTVDNFIRQHTPKLINDLSSKEGIRRLSAQFKKADPTLSDDAIAELVKNRLIAAENSLMLNRGKWIKEMLKRKDVFEQEQFLDDIPLENYFPLNNAYYNNNSLFNRAPTVSNTGSTNNSNIINLVKPEEFNFLKNDPTGGYITLGKGHENSLGTLSHETGHAIQTGSPLPFETELQSIYKTVRKNPFNLKSYADDLYRALTSKSLGQTNESLDYFLTGSNKKEAYPFIREFKENMIRNGIINNVHDEITFNKLLQAKLKIKPNTKDSRILDITPPWDWKKLSKAMNEAPAIVPIGIGLGATGIGLGAASQIPQNKYGGLHKFIGGGPTDCGENMRWDEALQECVKDQDQKIPETTVSALGKEPDNIEWYESWNPRKWGLNDYSEYSSFDSAFKNARKSKEPNFVYKGKRYTTLLEKDKLTQNKKYKEALDYTEDYMQSPKYKEMLKRSTNSKTDYKDILKNRFLNLKSIPSLEILPQQPKDEPRTNAYSRTSDGKITMLPLGFNSDGTYIHEISHSVDRPNISFTSRIIPESDSDYINKHKAKSLLESRKYKQDPAWYNMDFETKDKEFKEFYTDYVGKDTETRARLNSIRESAKKNNLYDPFTQGVSPELYYNKLKDFEFDKDVSNPMFQLKGTYSDEEIIWMLNNISKNENKQEEGIEEGVGKKGGYIDLELTPEEIEEYRRGGFTVEEIY